MDSLKEYLPASAGGYLPYWMLFVSFLALFNTVQNFTTTQLTKRVYGGRPAEVTPLQSRTFGLWTLTSALIRSFAAYNITDKSWYSIALATYVIVCVHYLSELFIFRTARLNAGLLSPLIVGTLSLGWMSQQYEYYVS